MPHFFRTDKKLRVIHLAIILMLLFMMFAIPQRASACSCNIPASPVMEFSGLDAVFSGRVVNIRNNRPPIIFFADQIAFPRGIAYFNKDRFWGNTITFEVANSWKLVATTRYQVRTRGDCGYGFSLGSDYLIYAIDTGEEVLSTTICTRTTELSMATEDLAYLNTMQRIPLTQSLNFWNYLIAIIIFITLALSVCLMLFIRQRKQHQTESQPH